MRYENSPALMAKLATALFINIAFINFTAMTSIAFHTTFNWIDGLNHFQTKVLALVSLIISYLMISQIIKIAKIEQNRDFLISKRQIKTAYI
ncbi:MAG: hypothetical protein EOP42_22660, partial [Sphingobacteriaceae bacterium]